jgi:hypothetical protein
LRISAPLDCKGLNLARLISIETRVIIDSDIGVLGYSYNEVHSSVLLPACLASCKTVMMPAGEPFKENHVLKPDERIAIGPLLLKFLPA